MLLKTSFVCVALLIVSLLFASPSSAQTLSFTVQMPSPQVLPGETFVFQGTVTNNTGGSLNASDLLFNFSGFDPNATNVTQILGTPDFSLADGSTSSVVDLFGASLSKATSAGRVYPFDVSVQDIFGDQSNVETFTLMNAAPVPEFTYSLPLLLGLLAAVHLARRRLEKVRCQRPSHTAA